MILNFDLHTKLDSAKFIHRNADMAQLVEHNLAKVGVAGSSPVVRSIESFSRLQAAFFVSYLPNYDRWTVV